MTDDRSLERAARSWLEDGPTQVPDRAVEAALLHIETTSQERDLRIPWRASIMSTPARLAAAAVVVIAIVAGGAYALGPRSDGVGGPQTSPEPTATPTDAQAALVAYRSARDALCSAATATATPLHDPMVLIWDGSISAEQRADWVAALDSYDDLYRGLIDDLGKLSPPAELVAGHAANVAKFETQRTLIRQIADYLRRGLDAQAEGVDHSTDPIGADIENWEAANGLVNCP